jgi:hypothetical protein
MSSLKGYLSPCSKHYYKFEAPGVTFTVKGLRAFWGYKEGINPSGSPKKFSSLMDVINAKRREIGGWKVSKIEEPIPTKYVFEHGELGIQVFTDNMNRFVGWLNGYNKQGDAKKRTTFRDVFQGKTNSTPDGWNCRTYS